MKPLEPVIFGTNIGQLKQEIKRETVRMISETCIFNGYQAKWMNIKLQINNGINNREFDTRRTSRLT